MQEYHLYFCLRCGNVTPVKECRDDPECSFCHFTMVHLRETIPLQECLQNGTYWNIIRKIIQKNINKNSKVFDQTLFDKRAANDRFLEASYVPPPVQQVAPQPVYIPRCPTCGSPDLYYYGPNGVGGDWARNQKPIQYSCKNCGYRW